MDPNDLLQNTQDLFTTFGERIKKRFDAERITIPFPQRDVHIYEHKDL